MMGPQCSVVDDLVIERGGIGDYEALGGFHYRGGTCRPCAAVYVMRRREDTRRGDPVGVIVYVHPPANHAARNAATGGVISRVADRRQQLRMINRNIRTIARVIIEPRYRGLGLGARLVRETMPRLGVAMIEATAAMGAVHPIFERAGMRRFAAPRSPAAGRLSGALRRVGIGPEDYVDAERVQQKLDALPASAAQWIDREMRRFLKPCIKRRGMGPGLERTRFILSRLGTRCVYYLWLNPLKPPDWTAQHTTEETFA